MSSRSHPVKAIWYSPSQRSRRSAGSSPESPAARWSPGKDLPYRLDSVRKWPPAHWPLAFQGPIPALPRNDFATLEAGMARSARRRRSLAG